ncbi:MAG: ROK family protein [Propionibacteriaceae bacterium]|jgi:glucokinase|nr:ROK family protein [Propionibacteriaceae bacterium]
MIAAVDLGGTHLRVGWWRQGAWAESRVEPTRRSAGASGLLDQLVKAVQSGPPVKGLVLATAGTLRPASGHVVGAANLPLRQIDLRQILIERLGFPVAVMGDATAAALAEFAQGSGRGFDHGVFVTVSTGIGAGFVTSGALVSGVDDQVGELGHVPVQLGHRASQCPCGQRGCLETVASGSGLAARWAEATGQVIDAKELLAAAEAGAEPARSIVERGSTHLGAALAGLVRLFSPQVVVLGGGLIQSDFYVRAIRRGFGSILADSSPESEGLIRLASCQLSSALVGAALVGSGDPAATKLLSRSGFRSQLEDFQ